MSSTAGTMPHVLRFTDNTRSGYVMGSSGHKTPSLGILNAMGQRLHRSPLLPQFILLSCKEVLRLQCRCRSSMRCSPLIPLVGTPQRQVPGCEHSVSCAGGPLSQPALIRSPVPSLSAPSAQHWAVRDELDTDLPLGHSQTTVEDTVSTLYTQIITRGHNLGDMDYVL